MELNNFLKEDIQVQRDSILTSFVLSFYGEEIAKSIDSTEKELAEFFDDAEIWSLGIELIIEHINNGKLLPEACMQNALVFGAKELDKLESVTRDGISFLKISEENMIRNYTEKELQFNKLVIDVVIQYYQHCIENSYLSEDEANDWDLDMMNFGKSFGSAREIELNSEKTPKIAYADLTMERIKNRLKD